MSLKYSFFKSIGGDRAYYADDFADRFRSFIADGVITEIEGSLTTQLNVTANDSDLVVSVDLGQIIIQGYFGEVYDTAEEVTLDAGDALNPRIDRIVMEVNINDSTRAIVLKVVKGTPASSPTAPSLTRDLVGSNVFQVSLAQVLVPTSASLILDSNVTDERSDTSVCGVAKIDLGLESEYLAGIESIKYMKNRNLRNL